MKLPFTAKEIEALKESFASRETGAKRESIGTKISTLLVPYELIVAAAVGLNYGENKYGARNYEKGLSFSDLLMSIERHNKSLMDGETIDSESGIPHYCLLASSVAMLCHNIMQHRVIDDRPEPKKGDNPGTLAKMGQALFNERA